MLTISSLRPPVSRLFDSGAETLRSSQLETSGHRLSSHAIEGRSGQRTQGSICTDFTQALDRAENILGQVSANQLLVPGLDPRSTSQRSGHSESGYSGSSLQTDLPKSKPNLPSEPMPPQLELPPELQPPQQEQQPTVRRLLNCESRRNLAYADFHRLVRSP